MDDQGIPVRPLGPPGEGRVLSRAISPILAYPLIDSRAAAAGALRAYLACQTFKVWGGGAALDRPFTLTAVLRQWPDPQQPLNVPIAVVLDPDPGQQQAWSLTPAPLEETWDRECGTVLWKTAELVATLQADFWMGNEPEREGVAAALPAMFSPNEDSFGVFLETSAAYFSQPVRISLLDMQRPDDAGSIYPRERRLSCTFRAELAEVHKKGAVEMQVGVNVTGFEPCE